LLLFGRHRHVDTGGIKVHAVRLSDSQRFMGESCEGFPSSFQRRSQSQTPG